MPPEPSLSSLESVQRAERLLAVSRLMSTSPDSETFLDLLIATAAEMTGCENASILAWQAGSQFLQFLAVPKVHRPALKLVQVPVQASLAGWVLENQKAVVVQDVSAEPRHFKGADLAAGFVTRSLIAVPVTFQGEKLGILEVLNKTAAAHYTEQDLKILEDLASLAAIALQNSRLVNQVNQSLEQSAQLDLMKSDFIAIASHELRTPLGLILGHATFLQEIVVPEYRYQLEIIVRNAMRLKEIIDSIANMDNAQSKTASLRSSSVSIKGLIEDVLESFSQEAVRKKITLRGQAGPTDLTVEGDRYKISMAVNNVVKNALDFTNPGGHVTITAGQVPGYVQLSIIDDGIGIPEKDLVHIFERFYQVESHLTRKHGGMGLGLSVSKVMTELHGGRLQVESVEGQGSKFTFLLPVKPPQVEANSPVIVP